MSFGKVIFTGSRPSYDTVFSFSFKDNSTFMFLHRNAGAEGQNDAVIEEVRPPGTPGRQNTEKLDKYYYALTPLYVEDRVFYYGQNEASKSWFIQELRPGGIFGPVTAQGTWSSAYAVMRGFKVAGRTFLLYHNSKPDGGSTVFIQEVLPGGTLGQTTESQQWGNYYPTIVPLEFDHTTYIFFQSEERNYWFIQEVSKYGKFGPYVDGTWENFYDEAFAFKMESRSFLCLSSKKTDKQLFSVIIREVFPNGTVGEITAEAEHQHFFRSLNPYTAPPTTGYYGECAEHGYFIMRDLLPPSK